MKWRRIKKENENNVKVVKVKEMNREKEEKHKNDEEGEELRDKVLEEDAKKERKVKKRKLTENYCNTWPHYMPD